MTHCYNCGHAGTFVLLVQFALAVPGPDAPVGRRSDHPARERPPGRGSSSEYHSPGRRPSPTSGSTPRNGSSSGRRSSADYRPPSGDGPSGDLPSSGDLSLAVQCPACDSTDVGVAAADLLARYGSSTTS